MWRPLVRRVLMMTNGGVMRTQYVGIDYGLSQSNIDRESGIHYGVIRINSLNLDCVYDGSFDEDYGTPTCPKCGNECIPVMLVLMRSRRREL